MLGNGDLLKEEDPLQFVMKIRSALMKAARGVTNEIGMVILSRDLFEMRSKLTNGYHSLMTAVT
jgi:hypothetical protein